MQTQHHVGLQRALTRYLRTLFIGIGLLFLVFGQTPAWAQDTVADTSVRTNFVYAKQFGFGSYAVGGLSVQIYTLPLPYTFHFGQDDAWGLKVKAELIYGRFDFEFEGAATVVNELSVTSDALGGTLGLELQIPVLDHWMLKPFGQGGLIDDFHTDVSPAAFEPFVNFDLSYTYSLGIRSLFDVDWQRFTYTLGNALIYAGDSNFEGDSHETYTALETGIDIRHPLGFKIKQYEPDASIFFIHYHFFPALEFSRVSRTSLEVDNQFEFGFTVGAVEPLQLWVISGLRLGVSYRFGDNLEGIRVNFGFPF